MAITKDDVKDFIKEMKVKELSELIKELEEELGVSAAAPVAVAAVGAAPAGTGEAGDEAEKTEFNVVITSVGQQKIQVIKAVKEITGLGLKEAKELAEKEGAIVKEKLSKEEAEKIREKLESVGATVDLK